MKDQILSDTVIAHIFYVCQIIQLLMFPQAERLYMYMQMERKFTPCPLEWRWSGVFVVIWGHFTGNIWVILSN